MLSCWPGGRAPALACRTWGYGRHTPCPHGPYRLIRHRWSNPQSHRGRLAGGGCQEFYTRTASCSRAGGLCPPRRKATLPNLSFQAANSC